MKPAFMNSSEKKIIDAPVGSAGNDSCIRAQSIETMATAHLISGLPCSGKTTYSMALSADADRVCFSLDCWLITSFGPYSIDSVGHDEHVRRVLVCRQLIWEVVSEFL